MAAKTKSELIIITTNEFEKLDKLCASIDAPTTMEKRKDDTLSRT